MALLNRIVTFKRYPDPFKGRNPQEILEQGSQIISLSEKRRYFVMRKVFYDENHTPIYSLPSLDEVWFERLGELISLTGYDNVILDNENYMKVWEEKNNE